MYLGADSTPAGMLSRNELEKLFLDHLQVVEKILGALARRNGISADMTEEFAAWAKSRIIENDYVILAKFRGESSVSTYLTVVCAMLFREYRVQEWGRWRPSAAARRGGELLVRLELLTQRDRLPLSQAGELLRTSGQTELTDRELSNLLAKVPRRFPLRPVESRSLPVEHPGNEQADDLVGLEEANIELASAQTALQRALDALPDDERLIVRLRYMEDLSVADIARGLSLPQKPLYRKLERAIRALRTSLERAGVSREHVRELAIGPP